jgi:hypothetical protein
VIFHLNLGTCFYRFVDCHERLKHTFAPVIKGIRRQSARPNWNWFEKDIYESYYIIDIFITSKK